MCVCGCLCARVAFVSCFLPAEARPGDWICPNCGDLVFASKSACTMCGQVKTADAEAAEAEEEGFEREDVEGEDEDNNEEDEE